MSVLRAIILGCGSSAGAPRSDGSWGACDPTNLKNHRRRCSLLLERFSPETPDQRTIVLIDTPPELRLQLADHKIACLNGVFYTHAHADQTHGIDDLRPLYHNSDECIDLYMDAQTTADLTRRFDYCFETPPGSFYPPIAKAHIITALEPVSVTGPGGAITLTPFEVQHGSITALGFRVGPLAYLPDASDIPDHSLPALQDMDTWIIDALRYRQHPTHFSVEVALDWVTRLKPARAVLTNLHIDLDYDRLKAELPAGVEPAYDNMVLEFKL